MLPRILSIPPHRGHTLSAATEWGVTKNQQSGQYMSLLIFGGMLVAASKEVIDVSQPFFHALYIHT